MLSLAEIVQKLQDRSGKVVAEKTGVHFVTISRIKRGHVDNPNYDTMQKLSEYFERNQ